MTEFKTWVSHNAMGQGWFVLRSSLPTDTRPFRILAKFNDKESAITYLESLWRN